MSAPGRRMPLPVARLAAAAKLFLLAAATLWLTLVMLGSVLGDSSGAAVERHGLLAAVTDADGGRWQATGGRHDPTGGRW